MGGVGKPGVGKCKKNSERKGRVACESNFSLVKHVLLFVAQASSITIGNDLGLKVRKDYIVTIHHISDSEASSNLLPNLLCHYITDPTQS